MNRTAPKAMGTATPAHAIRVALRPVFLSSLRSVPRPASNISIMTPISAILDKKSVSFIKPKTAGPNKRPASISPTTSGAPIFLTRSPSIFAANNMIARSSKNCMPSIVSHLHRKILSIFICNLNEIRGNLRQKFAVDTPRCV